MAGAPTGPALDVPLVTVANRLPVVKTRSGWRDSDGGLASALRPALEAARSRWIGWDGATDGRPRSGPPLPDEITPISLERAEVEGFYHGFSNRTIWPLFHGLVDRVTFERSWWHRYRHVNETFARVAADVSPPDSLLWVHDYQLLGVPLLLRQRGLRQPVGFFLHVPFPAPELFARLPWRSQLLDGMLGADVVGFQTEEYRQNFVRTCLRLREDAVLEDDGRLLLDGGRFVTTVAHPISIDAGALDAQGRSAAVARTLARLRRQFRNRRVLVGVDRLDYTKGIVERLRAIELLLAERRELRGKVSFLQIAVPSRGDIREYRELRAEVEEMVGRINGRFTDPGDDVPVHYLYRGVRAERLVAYYQLADTCLVTPLRDGMNLVAKEFVVAQAAVDGAGVLVLSEFAGASEELREALPCNPFDVEGLAATIELALELGEDDRRWRIERLARRVRHHDVHEWLAREVDAIRSVRSVDDPVEDGLPGVPAERPRAAAPLGV